MKNIQLKTIALLSVCFMMLVVFVSVITEENAVKMASATDGNAAVKAITLEMYEEGFAKIASDRELLEDVVDIPDYDLVSESEPLVGSTRWKIISDEMSGNMQLLFPKLPDDAIISVEDDYMNRTARITIDNCQPEEYSLDEFHHVTGNTYYIDSVSSYREKDAIKAIKVIKEPSDNYNGAERIIVEVIFDTVYVYEVHEYNDICCIDVRNPKDVYKNIIVVDAGHGGIDNGCSTRDGSNIEKKVTLSMVKELKKLLDKTNVKTYYTRLGDDSLALAERSSLANELKADLFISIHCNYYEYYWIYDVHGVETLFSSTRRSKKDDSKKLASNMLDSIVKHSGISKREVIDTKKKFYILRNSKVPTTIIETGYMSHSKDLAYFTHKKKLKSIVNGIYDGIMKSYKDIYGIDID